MTTSWCSRSAGRLLEEDEDEEDEEDEEEEAIADMIIFEVSINESSATSRRNDRVGILD